MLLAVMHEVQRDPINWRTGLRNLDPNGANIGTSPTMVGNEPHSELVAFVATLR